MSKVLKHHPALARLSAFEQAVLAVVRRVPRGRVTTYQELARAVGTPQAARAVGNALHKNPCAPAVPCHRVVKSDGALGGYGGGSPKKIALLSHEGVQVRVGRVQQFDSVLFEF